MSVNSSTFPLVLKSADVTLLYKKDSRYQKSHYRFVSVLHNLLKIFENVAPYFEKIFSKYQTGFWKGFNPKTCLEAIIEKFRKSFDDGLEYAALLTDLSKAFGCLPHDLIFFKIHAGCFDMPPLKVMHSCLTNRYQRIKDNSTYIAT